MVSVLCIQLLSQPLTKQPHRLHNEILDFYDWVAPQGYEHDARSALVERVNNAMSAQKWFPQDKGTVLPFGSFPAGLYLPTADMDLVYCSDRHCRGGPPVIDPAADKQGIKRMLWKAAKRLQSVGIATNPSVIPSAKVPIIKFQDRLTGLDVDVSFENLSGVQAQSTFQDWKERYPDLSYMVALLKQLLVMRGLNEVHSGGLGGFSIICLIVAYLELHKKPENLGECFLGFLEYYGKTFDLRNTRIQMVPVKLIAKVGLAHSLINTFRLMFYRMALTSMVDRRRTAAFPFKIPIVGRTTFQVDRTRHMLSSRSLLMLTTLSWTAWTPPDLAATGDPAFSTVFLAATTRPISLSVVT